MEIKKICVVGAGIMGSQIAQLVAKSGYEVLIIDVEDRFVHSSLDSIKGNLKKFFVDKGKMTQEEANVILDRIKGAVDLKEAVSGVQLAIECIPEDLALKQKMFRDLDELCAPETILASNTSSMSITAIGSLTNRQDKVIGTHFFNPVAKMRLIEVVLGARTSGQTYEVIKNLAVNLNKEIITVKDSPGFVVSRLIGVLTNEAAKILYEGLASAEDIDKACELGLGHAMGPLKTEDLANAIGITLHSLEYLRAELGESYRPCPLWKKKVLAGELGVKAGKGFYTYTRQ